jgi:type I restriction enzyme M protein
VDLPVHVALYTKGKTLERNTLLDTETKRRIDTARDILVGKVPDPKSQVEQITIALIYKFMDDMDAESEELGGKRKFFTGNFARYGWAKLMYPGLSGHEMLNLYAEGITKMPENPGIPLLFRDIFKNAYLPYRDPETLKSFLKIIDEFRYDHSERLGDAFEYLLSVLGSQGDAGQFRTPRHIIDFIVSIVDPKKTETILDPACGTAGFLISAYKHVLRCNTDAKGKLKLTPEEKGRLAKNIKGYDISPDMVRLSLVNLYLHGFPLPQIYEYDTLTSEERWNELADVILANPPFMSPKGGIKPHKRFSIDAKRSEVLFVDYMAEHLTTNGRAGIIVPEGIIFQSQGAYKDLRKMLVQNSLVAVISLPAGCFNPYSGVKTSILILDKSLAKQSDTIGFFKVENDGFGLGAQRRAMDGSDLPQVKVDIDSYFHALRSRKPTDGLKLSCGLIVPKEKMAANGDYNLSRERYREGSTAVSTWPFVPVGDVFRKSDKTVTPESLKGPVTYLGLENISQNTGGIEGNIVTDVPSEIKSLKNVFKPRDILYGKLRPNLNKVWLADREGICSTDIFVIEPAKGNVESALFAYLFRSGRFNDAVMGQLKGAQLPRIGWQSFAELQIPLPPLEVQKEIVAEIEGYQKVIDGARAVLDNYRPHIPIHPDWPLVQIKEVAAVESGYGFPLDYQGKTDDEIPFLKVSDMNLPGNEKEMIAWNHSVSRAVLRELKAEAFPKGTVIFPKIGAAIGTNKKRILTRDSTYDNNVMGIVPDTERLLPDFLHTYLLAFDLSRWASESEPPSMRKTTVEAYEIPLPPLATQQAIVAEIEAEQSLVAANRELIARFEKKIQATLARVWGET